MAWQNEYTHVEVQNAAGTWVEVTDYVRPTRADVRSSRGRDTELDRTGVPGQLTMGLDNASGIFTPGRSAAALQITLGMPVRVTDVIGYRSFRWFTGTFEMPDTVEDLEGVDNIIVVTAVDRKQLLDNGRTFISTLTEYVRYTGRSTLVGYWSMNDAATSGNTGRCESLIAGQGPLLQEMFYFGTTVLPSTPLLRYASLAGPVGDDAFYPQWSVGGDGTTSQTSARLANRELSGVTLTNTYLVIGLWVLVGSLTTPNQTFVLRDNAFVQSLTLTYNKTAFFQYFWRATVTTATGTTNVDGSGPTPGWWQYIAVRVNTSTSVVDLYVDSEVTSASYVGTLSGQFDSIAVDAYSSASSAGHLQIHRAASSSSYDQTTHLAQSVQGRAGLVGQRPDERIATVLRYAGAPAGALDEGSTYMQRASLAGKKPGQCIGEATDTEVGRFFVDGSGISRFHNRARAHYNL